MQVWSMQGYNYVSMQVCKYLGMHVSSMQVYKYVSRQVRWYANM